MNALLAILRELAGLFVDDGSLAVAILCVVALAGICVAALPQAPLAAGAILLLGCLSVLAENVMRVDRHLP